jgi:hypothetical protein
MGINISESEWKFFKNYVLNMPPEAIEQIKRKNATEAEILYRKFKEKFEQGLCDSCGNPLSSFHPDSPCFHWLLRPEGSKKENIEDVFKVKGYFRTASYIRWVCNQDVHLSRINDLSEEGDRDAIFHWSAQYRHIKWTFLCKSNDYQGHENRHIFFPHYHVEMCLLDKTFIKFNDLHLKFTDEDLFNLKCDLDETCPVKQTFGPHGSGMEDAFSVSPEDIIKETQTTNDQSNAVYHIQTVLMDKNGIPGEKISEAIKKARETGKPIANFLSEMGYSPKIIIAPPENIPQKQIRHHPRKKKKS